MVFCPLPPRKGRRSNSPSLLYTTHADQPPEGLWHPRRRSPSFFSPYRMAFDRGGRRAVASSGPWCVGAASALLPRDGGRWGARFTLLGDSM